MFLLVQLFRFILFFHHFLNASCNKGKDIHRELQQLGGLEKLDLQSWRVSDDTVREYSFTLILFFLKVMHLATGEALLKSKSLEELYPILCQKYVDSFDDMAGRAPGPTTGASVRMLNRTGQWDIIPYARSGGGCGGIWNNNTMLTR